MFRLSAALLALMACLALADLARAREVVPVPPGYGAPGTIVIRTAERRLYLLTGDGHAIRYPVAVGRAGKQWTGVKYIQRKAVDPHWGPPAEVRRDNPRLPAVVPPGPANPLGPRALALGPGGEYAIHGTNNPRSIGTFASYGCIRMNNPDIIDLFDRVAVGTRVVVMP